MTVPRREEPTLIGARVTSRPLPDFSGAARPRPPVAPPQAPEIPVLEPIVTTAPQPAAPFGRRITDRVALAAPLDAIGQATMSPTDAFAGFDDADDPVALAEIEAVRFDETLEIESDFGVKPGPLSPEDVPIGRPLAWRICDVDGSLLLDAGAVLPSARDRDFLFEQFQPQCDYGSTGSPLAGERSDDHANAGALKLSDMGLKIGSRLGVRSRLNGVEAACGSRVIGMAPNEAIFITPPTSSTGRLAIEARDTVQVVAVSARAVYLFICDVEFVNNAPTPFVILSKPRSIRSVRERRAERIKTRFPVIFSRMSTTQPTTNVVARGMGIANDISELGMALSTQHPIGSAGEHIAIRFYLDMHASTVCVEVDSLIRNVKVADGSSDDGVGFEYGLEFQTLAMDAKLALHSFVLSHRSMG